MKNILLVIATIMISAGAYAQTDATNRTWNQSDNKQSLDSENRNHPDEVYQSDGFMYQNGNMLLVKDGKITRVENDTTLSNGTVIMRDGNYMEAGGRKVKFKEGEHMDMSGKVTSINTSRQMQDANIRNYPDGYFFQNGQVMKIENGRMTPVDRDVTLPNGTVIMRNGNYMEKGGRQTMFKEGEHMDMSGNIVERRNIRSND